MGYSIIRVALFYEPLPAICAAIFRKKYRLTK